MVNVFGNNIVSAFTNGASVKEIYNYGKKVWPNSDYIIYEYLEDMKAIRDESPDRPTILPILYESPRIEFEIPYVEGGFIIEATVMSLSGGRIFYNSYSDNNDTYDINGAFIFRAADRWRICTYHLHDYREGTEILLGNHTIKEIIPANNLDTKIYVDDSEEPVIESTQWAGWEKTDHTFSVSEPIKMVLFDKTAAAGSNTHLRRFKIMDSSNNLLYDFVPAVRTADGVPGLLEVIHNTFYTRAGKKYNDTLGVLNFNYGNY